MAAASATRTGAACWKRTRRWRSKASDLIQMPKAAAWSRWMAPPVEGSAWLARLVPQPSGPRKQVTSGINSGLLQARRQALAAQPRRSARYIPKHAQRRGRAAARRLRLAVSSPRRPAPGLCARRRARCRDARQVRRFRPWPRAASLRTTDSGPRPSYRGLT